MKHLWFLLALNTPLSVCVNGRATKCNWNVYRCAYSRHLKTDLDTCLPKPPKWELVWKQKVFNSTQTRAVLFPRSSVRPAHVWNSYILRVILWSLTLLSHCQLVYWTFFLSAAATQLLIRVLAFRSHDRRNASRAGNTYRRRLWYHGSNSDP